MKISAIKTWSLRLKSSHQDSTLIYRLLLVSLCHKSIRLVVSFRKQKNSPKRLMKSWQKRSPIESSPRFCKKSFIRGIWSKSFQDNFQVKHQCSRRRIKLSLWVQMQADLEMNLYLRLPCLLITTLISISRSQSIRSLQELTQALKLSNNTSKVSSARSE